MVKSNKEKVLLTEQLAAFKRKFYVNRLIRGLIFGSAVVLMLLLFITSVEFLLWLNSTGRFVLLVCFILTCILSLFYFIVIPISKLIGLSKGISDEEAAKIIGRHFKEIDDKLLNIIQLKTQHENKSALLERSIQQKTEQIHLIPFSRAVDLRTNIRKLRFLVTPGLVVIAVLLFIPQLLTESSTRIIAYDKEFIKPQPFYIEIENKDFTVYRNEDFKLTGTIDGSTLPNELFLVREGQRTRINLSSDGQFDYTLKRVRTSEDIYFTAAGINSKKLRLNVVDRPSLKRFQIILNYPAYTGKQKEVIENNASLQLAEGTKYEIQLQTAFTSAINVKTDHDLNDFEVNKSENQVFSITSLAMEPKIVLVTLQNNHGINKEKIEFNLDVINDRYPEIDLQTYLDTLYYKQLLLGGQISDDYGIKRFQLFYREESGSNFQKLEIPFNKQLPTQQFLYNWNLDFGSEKRIEYYLQVSDNDGVNGSKTSKTPLRTIVFPTKKGLKKKLEEAAKNTSEEISKSAEEAENIQEKIEEAKKDLSGKKRLDWKDKARLEEIIEQRKSLEKRLAELKKENERFNLQQERFNEPNEKLKKKAKELQQLMEDLLDEETKKLYEELQKLLKEEMKNEIQENLEKLSNSEENLEKELERALELFKRMKMEYKLNEVINDLEDIQEKQEDLLEETQDKSSEASKLSEKQKELEEAFHDTRKNIEELQKLNNDLKNPQPLQPTNEEEEEINRSMKESSEQLDGGKKNKSSKSQEQSLQNLQKLTQKMAQMQAGMEIVTLQENIQNLRDIVDNLVTLSFNQEEVMKEFREVNQSDPRFISLSQKQLKLKDDAAVVEDSLLALAERVFQIQSFVTREVTEMNNKMNDAIEYIRDRKQREASSYQQLAMTSMNNLANLLDDILQQMQMQMADAMGQPNGKPKPGSQPVPSLSDLQKQLGQKIEQLKKSGKKGRALSEELAKLAAEQERLRQLLEEESQKAGNQNIGEDRENGGDAIGEILKKMEETELDLVNKNITQETIERQKQILSRLLKAEEAIRERELDNKREAETASEYEKIVPDAFKEYIRLKEKQIELLQTVPLKLSPYFKNEVNQYFRRLESRP